MPRNPLFVIYQLTAAKQTHHKIHSPVSDWKKSNDDTGRLQDVMPVLIGNPDHHGDAEWYNSDGGRQKGRLSAEFFQHNIYEIMTNMNCIFTMEHIRSAGIIRMIAGINVSSKYASPIHVPALLHLKDLEFQSSFAEFLSKSDSPEKVQGSETRGVRISHLTTKASKLWHPPAASQIYLNFQSSNLYNTP